MPARIIHSGSAMTDNTHETPHNKPHLIIWILDLHTWSISHPLERLVTHDSELEPISSTIRVIDPADISMLFGSLLISMPCFVKPALVAFVVLFLGRRSNKTPSTYRRVQQPPWPAIIYILCNTCQLACPQIMRVHVKPSEFDCVGAAGPGP